MKQKTCLDCLHCKVSAKSTAYGMVCFCSQNKKKTFHNKAYWTVKTICKKFVDMTEKPLTMVIIKADVVMPSSKRKPLLPNKFFL